MFALLAFAFASELSGWKGETNEDMTTLVSAEPSNRTLPPVQCPRCFIRGMVRPPGCEKVPPCARPGVRSLSEENKETSSRFSILPKYPKYPGLVCPPGWRLEKGPMELCVPAFKTHVEENQEHKHHFPGRVCPGCDGHGILPRPLSEEENMVPPPRGDDRPPFPGFPWFPHPLYESNDGWKASAEQHRILPWCPAGWPPGKPTPYPCIGRLLESNDGWKAASLDA